ncbi:pentapeptide repeat-containing protein [Pleurocapsales cyanobacterium LEGE 06147]|nr:pentapeptide repeat-containing protein [Pleurocapsales cyanobacterium LEGE 06147]
MLIFSLLIIAYILLFISPALAITTQEAKTILTSEILKARINNLVPKEGLNTVDLSNLIIDLTDKNLELRDQFYQQVQTKFSRTSTPLVLDLSQSSIQGEFSIGKLGIQTPLAEGALSSVLTPLEQEKIKNSNSILLQPGEQIPSVTVWRGGLLLNQTEFIGIVDLANTLYLQKIIASEAIFRRDVNWSNSRFFSNTKFEQAKFAGIADFTHSYFYDNINWEGASFARLADFTGIECLKNANFSQVQWRDRVLFSKSRFLQSLTFNDATFEKTADFRDTRFNAPIDFQEANLFDQINFSDAIFTSEANLNVAGLAFESDSAKIIGQTGVIGKVISVPSLEGNETVLRNLVRNFRSLEQIPDANQIEYQREKLRLQQLGDRIIGTPWQRLWQFGWLAKVLHWLGLSLLLLLGDYGTNVSLVLGTGLIAIAYFSLLFWFVDRYRRRLPQPILPNRYETICMASSYSLFTLLGIIDIIQTTDRPWLTLACLAVVLLLVPAILLIRLYQQGRYHKLLDLTYFVEDGSMRQFRLMLGRLPIMPRFPFYRDRYEPILWDRRWNWLNYYDFSLNNLLKFGFNDIRLRDEHLPGIISALVWYQWSLGVLYIILLLWTLSRTIPGLNLLIYF